MQPQPNLLENYIRESEFAATYGISRRTVWRYRNEGLPSVTFGGEVFISCEGALDWLKSRERRRNQPATQRRRAS